MNQRDRYGGGNPGSFGRPAQGSGPGGGGSLGGSYGGGLGRKGGGPYRDDNADIKEALRSDAKVTYRSGKELRPDLLDKEAQDAAIALEQISTTQLRRFFEQVGAIKRRIDVDSNLSDSEILAQVAFLKASSAYAAARSKDNKAIVEFIVKHANSIKERRDFLDFQRHFEAVVAFHKVYGKDKKGN